MYIVKYSRGAYDDWWTGAIFVTEEESTARKYSKRFNKILKKLKRLNKRFEENGWIKEEYSSYFERWNNVNEINNCWYEEIEVR